MYRLVVVLVVIILISYRPSSATVCQGYGSNYVGEIRCLRLMLNNCVDRNAIIFSDDQGTSTTKSPPIITTTRPPLTTTTRLPPSTSPQLADIRSNLSAAFNHRIASIEARMANELSALEQRMNTKLDEQRRKSENEMRKLAKIIKLMTNRIHRFEGHEYIYMDERESWYIAEEECVRWGGRLASITSRQENEVVRGLHNSFVWIGLNDIQRENHFVWSDDTAYNYTHWKQGQPDNTDHNENCMEQDENGQWSDVFCFASRGYICKR